jgi:hypothetical protein
VPAASFTPTQPVERLGWFSSPIGGERPSELPIGDDARTPSRAACRATDTEVPAIVKDHGGRIWCGDGGEPGIQVRVVIPERGSRAVTVAL